MGTLVRTRPQQVEPLPPDSVIFGQSDAMAAVRQKVERLTSATIPVLIQGESGTGKEVVARRIHMRSAVADGPFVKVNCPAIPGTLLESELFGYEIGAFTGASAAKAGRIEAANGGSLFLDEIGDLDAALQAKLLQFLQDGQFCRLGATDDTRVELRVICATNRPLDDAVERGAFRRDLYYRINVVNLRLPLLRERLGDIPDLVAYFLEFYNRKYNLNTRMVSTQTVQLMQNYSWPGNIRELENLVKRYVFLASEEAIAVEVGKDNSTSRAQFIPNLPLDGKIQLKRITRNAVRELERQVILKALQANNWNRKQTARTLSISYRALLYKIRDSGLPTTHVQRPSAAG